VLPRDKEFIMNAAVASNSNPLAHLSGLASIVAQQFGVKPLMVAPPPVVRWVCPEEEVEDWVDRYFMLADRQLDAEALAELMEDRRIDKEYEVACCYEEFGEQLLADWESLMFHTALCLWCPEAPHGWGRV
jgi:hypothetical protein